MTRQQRLVFGEEPELYDLARPSYPSALVDTVMTLAGSGADVLDVGCGTAKATVLLAERGLDGIALEADPAMAAVATRNLSDYQGWRVEISDFESWKPQTRRSFDLVTCAQAWHWLDPETRFQQAHQLLRPEGWLALWWNRPAEIGTSTARAIETAMNGVYARVLPDLPARGIGAKGQVVIDGAGLNGLFAVAELKRFPWSKDYSAEGWTSLLRTQSNHRLADSEKLRELLQGLEDVINQHGGVYQHSYDCWLWSAQRQ